MIDGKYEYFAFISYKEEDAEWAKWLQRKLEHYKLPTALRKEHPHLPERISPIYEYKSEAGGGRLKEVIWKGLTTSKYLIVICSPRATQSDWLNDGIRHFIKSGQEENIIPFIVDGKPKAENADEECFPSALLDLKGDRELRGININEMGRDAATVKVVSRMFDVKFDSLWQRYERGKREKRNLIITSCIFALIVMVSVALWMYKNNQQTQQANWKMMENRARFIAEKGEQLIQEGDSYLASLLALEILPTDLENPDKPYTTEAEGMLRNALLRDNAILKGHTDIVYSAAFSPDGTRIVSASGDKTIRIWDVKMGKQIGDPLTEHTTNVYSASFSPDGTKIVSASDDNTIRIWDAETRRQIREPLTGHTNTVNSASFSPDGTKIVSASRDETIRIWEAETGQPIGKPLVGHTDNVNSASFSPDGTKIISASEDYTIRIWDVETGRQIGEPLRGHTGIVTSASFSPDGSKIVSASGTPIIKFESIDYDYTIRIWDVKTGKPIGEPLTGHTNTVTSASFSPDGTKIVSASDDKTIRIWDAKTGKQIGEPLTGHTGTVHSASFSPDGNKIVSASGGTRAIFNSESIDNTIRIWNINTERRTGRQLEGKTFGVRFASFSPDGTKIVSASGIKYYSSYLVVSRTTICLWNAETGIQIGVQPFGHLWPINSVSFSPDGKRIISASNDKSIRIWNAETGEPISEALMGHTGDVTSASYSQNGREIVSTATDSTLRIWDAETGEQIGEPLTGHTARVNSASFSPDGKKIVSTANDSTIRIWDAKTGKQIGEPLTGHTGTVHSASFSPDGTKIVSASNDKTIRIWNTEMGRQIGEPLTGHTSNVYSASFSPDGTKIVSASSDETIRIWDAETGRQIGEPLTGHTEAVYSASFSPDGRKIVSASSDKTVRVWDYPPLQELIDQTRERFKDRELTPEERRMYYLE